MPHMRVRDLDKLEAEQALVNVQQALGDHFERKVALDGLIVDLERLFDALIAIVLEVVRVDEAVEFDTARRALGLLEREQLGALGGRQRLEKLRAVRMQMRRIG